MRQFRYLFLVLIIFTISVLLSNNYLSVAWAQTTEKALEMPKTLKEAGRVGKDILQGFPQVLKKLWQEAKAAWSRMVRWFSNFWNSYIAPWLKNIWQREVEKKKPEVKEEFEKEKQEMKEEVSRDTKTLWERFKELIR